MRMRMPRDEGRDEPDSDRGQGYTSSDCGIRTVDFIYNYIRIIINTPGTVPVVMI